MAAIQYDILIAQPMDLSKEIRAHIVFHLVFAQDAILLLHLHYKDPAIFIAIFYSVFKFFTGLVIAAFIA
jgi:hypothetical protein